ncbi:hypothetical protein PCASD_06655 [Puccinia coronata f. sp. avenae]|uniref:Cysteine-rich PDZ-binding protein n=1 Tax=Puccinia coronata f. sp. avenae TaxID=200324 RepID=A0A2N5UGV3_9BASI|nr:hypothetical protein PCASD_06655 [Puccinia coronata f. sp. avenae]
MAINYPIENTSAKRSWPKVGGNDAHYSLATPEVRGIAGSNTAPIAKRKIGENKLLSSKNRYTPYASSASSSSKPNQPPHSLIGRCLTCKANVARPSAKYCQPCAYKKVSSFVRSCSRYTL